MSEEKKVRSSNSAAQKEMDQVGKQFDEFDANIKSMTLDRMNAAPKEETELKAKMSNREIQNSKDLYLKPKRTISSKEKFNEAYRDEYNFAKEYVHFIAENREIIGETITLWTKKFAGQPAEEWEVPCNKPVWGPRYLAERIKNCNYHRFIMENKPYEQVGMGTMYGSMAVDTTVQRLDAHPVTEKKSIFMGSF